MSINNKLIYREENILQYFFSLLGALEVIYVSEGLKPMTRVVIRGNQLEAFTRFIDQNGLFMKQSKYASLNHQELGKGQFSNVQYRVPNVGENIYVYVSRDKERLSGNIDEMADDEFGLLLGYPKCCIAHYKENLERAKKNQLDFYPFACTEKVGSAAINFGMRYFGISVISHFPCSLHCEASMKISTAIQAFLEKDYPEIASYLKRNLRSAVIYLGKEGVFYSNDFKVTYEGEKINVFFENVKGTLQNSFYKELSESKYLEIIAHNCIKVNQNIYYGENVRGTVYL